MHHCRVVPNDRLVVEPFYETMELWHMKLLKGPRNPKMAYVSTRGAH
jgi:hypothetical protein